MVKQKRPTEDYSTPRPFRRGKGVRVPKTTSKTEVKVTVNIKPMKLADVSPAQRQQFRLFGSKLISQIKDEVKSER